MNSIPLFTVRDREQARPVPAPGSMYGTGSSAFPTNQKEMPAETRQAHRRTMEAQLRREPAVIRIQARKTAAIRILPVLHREAHILPMEMLPETGTIRAAVIHLVEAAIQMEAMAMRMGTVIIPMQGMAMLVPAIQITGMALQAAAIQTEAVTWATARSLRMEEPRKAVLTRQMPLHRIDPLETRCTSSRTETPRMANSRAVLPETGLPTSRKAWLHSFPLQHNFRITRLRSL